MNNFLLHINKESSRSVELKSEWLGNAIHTLKKETLKVDKVDLTSYATEKSLYKPKENLSVLIIKYYTAKDGDILAKEIAEQYAEGNLDQYFKKLDGELSIILVDSDKNKVVSYSDRFGLIPTYFYSDSNSIFLSSSPKYIFLNNRQLKVRKASLECFIDTGQLLGKHTWFDNVELIDSSTVIEIDLNSFQIKRDYYWSWGEVESQNITFGESVDKLAETFEAAVSKRKTICSENILLLSGGLDSRLILSCLGKEDIKQSYTFSKKKSEELEIAKSLSLSKKISHKHWELNDNNWIENRVENIWNLDAGFSFMHDHAAPFIANHLEEPQGVFNGFGGGILFAGNYIEKGNVPISEDKAIKHWGQHWKETEVDSAFYNIDKIEPYFLNTRLRRFTCSGTRTLLPYTPLLPFIDRDFITLLMSVDDNYRKERELFKAVALKLDKKLFTDYSYSQLGRPITSEKTLKYRLKGYYVHFLQKIFNIESISYVNYKKWSTELIRKRETILNKDSLIYHHLSIGPDKATEPFNIEKFGRMVTLELYLQQIYNEKFRTTQELKSTVS